jgi:ABC-type phosphate transport system auxiliary subunit
MSRPASLTGSPVTDRLVPAACALIEAVRNGNTAGVTAAFHEATGELAGSGADPAQALAVVLAGMVDDTTDPLAALAEHGYTAETRRLTAAGIDPERAGQLARNRTAA